MPSNYVRFLVYRDDILVGQVDQQCNYTMSFNNIVSYRQLASRIDYKESNFYSCEAYTKLSNSFLSPAYPITWDILNEDWDWYFPITEEYGDPPPWWWEGDVGFWYVKLTHSPHTHTDPIDFKVTPHELYVHLFNQEGHNDNTVFTVDRNFLSLYNKWTFEVNYRCYRVYSGLETSPISYWYFYDNTKYLRFFIYKNGVALLANGYGMYPYSWGFSTGENFDNIYHAYRVCVVNYPEGFPPEPEPPGPGEASLGAAQFNRWNTAIGDKGKQHKAIDLIWGKSKIPRIKGV